MLFKCRPTQKRLAFVNSSLVFLCLVVLLILNVMTSTNAYAGNGNTQPESWWGKEGEVVSIAYSPNGAMIAVASATYNDYIVNLWRIKDKKLIKKLSYQKIGYGSSYSTAVVVFSPNNKYLAVGVSKVLEVWNIKKNKMHKTSTVPTHVLDISYSPSGKKIAVATSDGVIIKKSKNLKDKAMLKNPLPVTEIEYFSTGKKLITSSRFKSSLHGENSYLKVWNLKKKKAIKIIPTDYPILSISLSPDDKTLAAVVGYYVKDTSINKSLRRGNASNLKLWDLKSGKEVNGFKYRSEGRHKFDEVSYRVGMGVDFSADGKLLASGVEGGWVTVWDVETKKIVRDVYADKKGSVANVDFGGGNDFLLAGGKANQATFWKLSSDSIGAIKKLLSESNSDFMKLVAVSKYYDSKNVGYVSKKERLKGAKLIKKYFDKNVVASTKKFANDMVSLTEIKYQLYDLDSDKYRSLMPYLDKDKQNQVAKTLTGRREFLLKDYISAEKIIFDKANKNSANDLDKLAVEVTHDDELRQSYKVILDDSLFSAYLDKHTKTRHKLLTKNRKAIEAKLREAKTYDDFNKGYLVYTSNYDRINEVAPLIPIRDDYIKRLYHFKPFLDLKGAAYLNAIYEGDYEKLRKVDRIYILTLMGMVNEYFPSISTNATVMLDEAAKKNSLIEGVMAVYLLNYKEKYSACLAADSVTVTIDTTTETTLRDGLGSYIATEYGPTTSTDYEVNKEFVPAFNRVYRLNKTPFFMNKISEPMAGVLAMMGEFSCSDPKVKRLETNLLRFYNEYNKLN